MNEESIGNWNIVVKGLDRNFYFENAVISTHNSTFKVIDGKTKKLLFVSGINNVLSCERKSD